MSEKKTFSIRLHIYDTDMAVTINREDEEYYRRAAQRITEKINAYTYKYRNQRNEKEILYMALIDIALRLEMETNRNDALPYTKFIVKLTEELKEMLNNDNI